MSEEDKTENATSRKLEKAREDGQIPRVKELSSTMSVILILSYFFFNADLIIEHIKNSYLISFHFNYHDLSSSEHSLYVLTQILFDIIMIFFPIFILHFITISLSSMLLGGWNFSLKSIQMKLERINPLAGIKRIYTKQLFTELIKNFIKVTVIAITFYVVISGNLHQLQYLTRSDFEISLHYIVQLITDYVSYLFVIALIFAFIDYPYQKYLFNKKMKMSKEEIKKEAKENEGNPEVKGRMKQVQQKIRQKNISKTVPDADVILINPTHYAVALKYDLEKATAPFVISKGIDDIALFIRQVGNENNIPIISLPEITRVIYNSTAINQMIPNQLFVAIAHVLNYINQLSAYEQGLRTEPENIPYIPIPKDLKHFL